MQATTKLGTLHAMSYLRSQLISSTEPGYYHCISRCVRRAYLCGVDLFTGQTFQHRKQWVEDRLHELAAIFAIGVYAYAVMSNHSHVVAYVDPRVAAAWSPDEVAQRWVRLCPVRAFGRIDAQGCRERVASIAADPKRVAVYRQRLCELSWFMRCLNEPIARRANREDCCTGRFWEGRYRCQALLDEAAVVSCMTYVDLNPIRAGLATDLASSVNTSVARRVSHNIPNGALLRPIAGPAGDHSLSLTAVQYTALVEWTGRRQVHGKRGWICDSTPQALSRYGADERSWERQVAGTELRYWRAIGPTAALIDTARSIGQYWLKGSGRVMRKSPAEKLTDG